MRDGVSPRISLRSSGLRLLPASDVASLNRATLARLSAQKFCNYRNQALSCLGNGVYPLALSSSPLSKLNRTGFLRAPTTCSAIVWTRSINSCLADLSISLASMIACVSAFIASPIGSTSVSFAKVITASIFARSPVLIAPTVELLIDMLLYVDPLFMTPANAATGIRPRPREFPSPNPFDPVLGSSWRHSEEIAYTCLTATCASNRDRVVVLHLLSSKMPAFGIGCRASLANSHEDQSAETHFGDQSNPLTV